MKKCKGKLAYESIGGVRVYREVNGRRVLKFRCTSCGHEGENNGSQRECSEKVKSTARG